MPTQQQETKPPRMRGIVPPPFEIPPEHLPVSKPAPSARQLWFNILTGLIVLRGLFYLFMALIPWNDPDSGLATFLQNRPQLVALSLPPFYQSFYEQAYETHGPHVQGIALAFLFYAVVCFVSAWKYLTMDKFWISIVRWIIMFMCGYPVAKMMIILSSRYVGEPGAPLSDGVKLFLFVTMVWDTFLFCCFAFTSRPEEAYDTRA